MINDRKFLLGSATGSPEIALTITRHLAFKSPKRPPERIGRPRIAVSGRRVSDNDVLCQPELDLEVGLGIYHQQGNFRVPFCPNYLSYIDQRKCGIFGGQAFPPTDLVLKKFSLFWFLPFRFYSAGSTVASRLTRYFLPRQIT